MVLDKEDCYYTNKFINRSRQYRKKSNKVYTNTYSNSNSRPTHHNGVIEYNRMVNNDIINYQAIDYIPSNDIHRKTAAPAIVSLIDQRINTQNHKKETLIENNKSDRSRRLVYLPEISKYMYLSNFCTVFNLQNELAIGKNIDVVINLSNQEMSRGLYTKVYNIRFKETRYIKFSYFLDIIKKVKDIINDCIREGKFLVICCDKGVNRSVSTVIAFNLSNENRTLESLEKTIDYIVNQKNDKNWPVLNNNKLYHFLQLIEINSIFP